MNSPKFRRDISGLRRWNAWLWTPFLQWIRQAARSAALVGLLAGPLLADPIGGQAASSENGRGAKFKVVVISDIHFDPFIDASIVDQLSASDTTNWFSIFERSSGAQKSLGNYGADSSHQLLKSLLASVTNRWPDTRFILCTGDFLAHSFAEQCFIRTQGPPIDPVAFSEKTEAYVAWLFKSNFPTTPVFPVLGNNDTTIHDRPPDGHFLRAFAHSWMPLLGKAVDTNAFLQEFGDAGHYVVTNLPGMSNHQLVVFNSSFMRNGQGNLGLSEIAWVSNKLNSASAGPDPARCWLAYHVPPGIDPYYWVEKDRRVLLWEQASFDRFREVLDQYAGTVAASFCGHTHRDEFRVIQNGTADSAFVHVIHIVPSVSPKYKTKPAYQVLEVNRKGEIVARETYYIRSFPDSFNQASDWDLEYSFSKEYGQQHPDKEGLMWLRDRLRKDPSVREKFINFYGAGAASKLTAKTWGAYFPLITLSNSPAGNRTR
jgi:sphingomyelin phosphodiesterase acid-like 3